MVSLVTERVIRRKLKDENEQQQIMDDLKIKRPNGIKRKATTEQNNNENTTIESNENENLLNSSTRLLENLNNNKKLKLDSNIVMFKNYQPWVMKTYGDFSKTKTVTLRKYARILRALRGEEVHSADSSKFRFWVKSKGFHIGKPCGYDAKPADAIVGRFTIDDIDNGDNNDSICDKVYFNNDDIKQDPALYVPTVPVKNAPVQTEPVYRKVAIVENFFDIIYNVHVELEGRPGKHAGQKRTYRTITETYAFLPREAVTKFLLGCTDCQRRPRSPSPLTSLISIQSAQQQQQNQPKFLLPPTNNAIRTTTNDKSNNKNETAFPANFETPKPLITTPPKSNFSSIADLSTSTVTPKDTDSDYTVCDLSDKQLGDDNETPKTRYLGPLRRNILANQFVNDLRKNNTKTPSPPEKNGEFDYNLPITTTYLKHMRTLGYTDEDALKFERYNK